MVAWNVDEVSEAPVAKKMPTARSGRLSSAFPEPQLSSPLHLAFPASPPCVFPLVLLCSYAPLRLCRSLVCPWVTR